MGAGERRGCEALKHHSGIPASGIPYGWSVLTVYVKTHVCHIAPRAQSQTNIASV